MKKFPHGPVRTCLGCGQKKVKQELIRLVYDGQNEVIVDTSRRLPGRGVYWCGADDCAARLKKNIKRLAWALRLQGTHFNCKSW